MALPELWKREFAKRNQWHSCLPVSIDDHFKWKEPALERDFQELVAQIQTFGPLCIDAVKTNINFISKYNFGGVMQQRRYLRHHNISPQSTQSLYIYLYELCTL